MRVTVPTAARRRVLERRIRLVVAATIGYNLVEAVVAIAAGAAAGSGALVAFGLDSTIEVLSAAAVAWQFTRRDPARWERPTLRLIAVAFFVLAGYAAATAVLALVLGAAPEHSPVGVVLTAISVVLMPLLSFAERRTGRELGSATAVADSRQTLLCAWLSVAVLAGLVLNATLGWWWVDPLAALVVAGFAVREGVEAWRGDACATSVGMLLDDDDDDDGAARTT